MSKEKQVCINGHDFLAKSHEYVCPWCELAKLHGALSDIRTLVTGCVSIHVEGDYKKTCEAVLTRSLSDIEPKKPTWFVHKWEEEIYRRVE